MTSYDERDLDLIDRELAGLFAEDETAPTDFTRRVLCRLQDERWGRERLLTRVFYGGLCASGVLAIGGLGTALGALTTLSNAAAVAIAAVALLLTGLATWPRLTVAS